MVLARSGATDNGKTTIICQTRSDHRSEGIRMKERIFIQDGAVEINPTHALVSKSAAIKPDLSPVGKRDT